MIYNSIINIFDLKVILDGSVTKGSGSAGYNMTNPNPYNFIIKCLKNITCVCVSSINCAQALSMALLVILSSVALSVRIFSLGASWESTRFCCVAELDAFSTSCTDLWQKFKNKITPNFGTTIGQLKLKLVLNVQLFLGTPEEIPLYQKTGGRAPLARN